MDIGEHFALNVLGENDDLSIAAEAVKLVGRRLIAKVSSPVPQDTCIRIDCDDSLILGHISGCWHEKAAIFVAVELEQALTGVSMLARSLDRFSRVTTPKLAVVTRQLSA